MVELGLGKQPAAGDLGAGHDALGHHFVDLAFLEAEVGGGFGGGEKLHDVNLHSHASFLTMPQTEKMTRDYEVTAVYWLFSVHFLPGTGGS